VGFEEGGGEEVGFCYIYVGNESGIHVKQEGRGGT
jgi:hypothetical protein